VRRVLAADRHRRGATADRADGDRRRQGSCLDELADVDDGDDRDLLVVVHRHPLFVVWLGFVSHRLLGDFGFVWHERNSLERNGLQRDQRFRLGRRDRPDRRGRDPQRRDRRRQLGLRVRRRLDERRRRPSLAGGGGPSQRAAAFPSGRRRAFPSRRGSAAHSSDHFRVVFFFFGGVVVVAVGTGLVISVALYSTRVPG
jgi:hypothetical protein